MNALKTVLWQWMPRIGLERCELSHPQSQWVLRGTILTLADESPVEARYEVRCGDAWNTITTDVTIGARSVRLACSNARWTIDGEHAPQLDGCRDVDLGWSPSTNTIAIRRLRLAVGERSGPLTMAWVRFPELTVEPLAQHYERLEERLYRYTSRDGSFRADLTVDEHDLVIDYEGIWKRVDV